ncbi:exodeoxyribonuclease V subunit alpha [Euzebya sp.]|uniref:exodeoxyribonuclease V subunit alpha n=1 Tax=Euzebya sp. TaxID=1971409 RepID=UPI003516BE7F
MRPDELDPHRADAFAGPLPASLRAFNDAGVLSAGDIHVARELARLTGTSDPTALLAAAFAVRAPRYGHVFAALDRLAETVTDEDGRAVDLPPDAWPSDTAAWTRAVGASPLVTGGPEGVSPLHLDGTHLYLDRYWRHEHAVADAVRRRVADGGSAVALGPDGVGALEGLLGSDPGQHAAARTALARRLAVISGGPGTGKTATVAALVAVALSHGRRADGDRPRVAIAAPTGKAAARLGEALDQAATTLDPALVDPQVLAEVRPTTLHRLLGWTPNRTRFRHDARSPLPHDLVIVDEVSMVSLAMLARLLEAVPPTANLLLVGDPDQLAAVEAGTVLDDLIVGSEGWGLADAVVRLDRGYRFDAVISGFAQAVRAGDVDGAMAALDRNPADLASSRLSLVVPDRPGEWPTPTGPLAPVQQVVTAAARRTVEHALAGDVRAALAATLEVEVLCAHRRGPEGVGVWNAAIEGWVHDLPSWRRPEWYPGRPVMVTSNDHELEVYNGDIGVVVRGGDDRLRIAIDQRQGRPIEHRRISGIETVHAMTVHKSQGSAFEHVVVVLPSDRSPVMTRELLYTAVTRARHAVTVVATEEALAQAIARPVSRASALPERLRR